MYTNTVIINNQCEVYIKCEIYDKGCEATKKRVDARVVPMQINDKEYDKHLASL